MCGGLESGGQLRRGRARPGVGRGRQRAEELWLDAVDRGARAVAGLDRRPAHRAALSGRLRIRGHPASQGDTRPGAGERDPGLGAARGRQGADRCRRGRAQRRARGCPRRPAHHARRVQCPAGSRQRPRVVASYTVLAATGARSHRRSSGSRSRSTSGSLPAGA